ncbi:MAG: PQQ-binding-like beta-propeller repeat protein [Planctomycetota bacterium]
MQVRTIMFLVATVIAGLAFADRALAESPLVSGTLPKVNDGFEVDSNDWPWWRGPLRNGTSAATVKAPRSFSATENVIWKAKVPGRGHGSPTVVGNQVFLATANEAVGSQSLLCYERDSGDLLWNTVVHAKGAMKKNKKASAASGTPAWDGEHAYICFPNSGALLVSALNAAGDIVWQKEVSKYVVHQGYGASPALYQDLVIVSSDNKSGGAVAAYRRKSGELVWKRERPKTPNYPSPTILNVAGKDQLVMVGCDKVASFDPMTGKTNWEIDGATTECVASTVTDGNLVYTSGGYPKDHMSAIAADGSGKLVWENKSRLYVPSLLIQDRYLYGVLDAGMAYCWKADTGEVMWKQRLGGTFSSSPVLYGDIIYAANEAGEVFVYKATTSSYQEVGKCQLGDRVFATPTIVGGKIYHRVSMREGDRLQEWLYCIGK